MTPTHDSKLSLDIQLFLLFRFYQHKNELLYIIGAIIILFLTEKYQNFSLLLTALLIFVQDETIICVGWFHQFQSKKNLKNIVRNNGCPQLIVLDNTQYAV